MAKRSILEQDSPTDINLSPMIDCIFILLIFFIVTTVFVDEKGFQANKPDAAASATLEDKENLTVEIAADNKIRMNDHEIGLNEVLDRVKAGVSRGEDVPVVIRAHEKADNGVFVAVWDAARRAGAHDLSFSTVN